MVELEAAWSRFEGRLCIRVRGRASEQVVEVRPTSDRPTGHRPPMVGAVVASGDDRLFVPRYPFTDGAEYEVSVAGASVVLHVPRIEQEPTAEVVSVHPTSSRVPTNLLRFSVGFSQTMGEGFAASCVRLTDVEGDPLEGALLVTDYELWDREHRRLTVLLDPGRIKQGLAGHTASGYPLRQGQPFRLVVDGAFPDAHGVHLIRGSARRYEVDGAQVGRVDPAAWTVAPPGADTLQPVVVRFDRTMDHALLSRCVRVLGPSGSALRGRAEIGDGERSWTFRPVDPWAPLEHRLQVSTRLEDVAGNSPVRAFDRDVRTAEGGVAHPSVGHRSFTPF